MVRKLILLGAWVGATALAVVLSATAVGNVRSEVTDQPRSSAPVVRVLADDSGTDMTTDTTPSTTVPLGPTTVVPAPITSSAPEVSEATTTTTTTVPAAAVTASTTTTTTTQPSPSTTTATAQVLSPYSLPGGAVTISVLEPNVWLVAAVPASGYRVDIENGGPDEVDVEFDSGDDDSEFRARWENGELLIEIHSND